MTVIFGEKTNLPKMIKGRHIISWVGMVDNLNGTDPHFEYNIKYGINNDDPFLFVSHNTIDGSIKAMEELIERKIQS